MRIVASVREYQSATKDGKVLMVFGSSGRCPTCDQLMEQIFALEKTGSPCAIYKTNVQNVPEEAARFSIRSVPAMVLFVEGEPKMVTFGFKKEKEIRAVVEDILKQK